MRRPHHAALPPVPCRMPVSKPRPNPAGPQPTPGEAPTRHGRPLYAPIFTVGLTDYLLWDDKWMGVLPAQVAVHAQAAVAREEMLPGTTFVGRVMRVTATTRDLPSVEIGRRRILVLRGPVPK
jgi:hypothetical protein